MRCPEKTQSVAALFENEYKPLADNDTASCFAIARAEQQRVVAPMEVPRTASEEKSGECLAAIDGVAPGISTG